MQINTHIRRYIVLISLLVLFFLGDILCGAVKIPFERIFSNTHDFQSNILFNIRFPRAITAILTGSGLALCGLFMQTLFRNPLAGPYVLGVSAGSSLFVALWMMLVSGLGINLLGLAGKSALVAASITGGLLITSLVLVISERVRNNVTLLLIGLMLGQIVGALQGLLEYFANVQSLKSFVIWGLGSLGNTTWQDLKLFFPLILVLIVASVSLIKSLNALLLGEAYAQNLGINVKRTRLIIIIITSCFTGLTTAFCGPIAFVGIAIPIASRLLFKTSQHQHQIVYCLLLGSVTLLGCDIISNTLLHDIVLPINIMTTIIGSPIVIYLMFKNKVSM